MGWLQRLFGVQKPQASSTRTNVAQASPAQASPAQATATRTQQQSIPPERLGLNGEYDESGLAKRVALAFDEDSAIDDINTLYVAQTGNTVVLKGKVPNQQILNKMISVARGVSGAGSVDTTQVNIG
ncbi:MAG TPA: BON domain-containing protein [Crinalium sp.]|jgi:osmotically-inducible protein OsmY